MKPDLFDGDTITRCSISKVRSKSLANSLENSCLLWGLLSCMQCGEDLQVTTNITSDSLLKYYCLSCHADPTCNGTNGQSTREPAILPIFHQAVLDEHVWHSFLHTITDSEQIGQCWRKLERANGITGSTSSIKQLDELDLEALSAKVSFEDKRQILSLLTDRIIVRPDAKEIFVEGPLHGLYDVATNLELAGDVSEGKEYVTIEDKELLARLYGYVLRQSRQRKIARDTRTH